MSGGTYILDDAGNPRPVDLLTPEGQLVYSAWVRSAPDIKRVAISEIPHQGDHIRVSTVFQGVDASRRPGFDRPVLWETVVTWTGHEHDGYTDCYTTAEEAKTGHAATVRWVKRLIEEEKAGMKAAN